MRETVLSVFMDAVVNGLFALVLAKLRLALGDLPFAAIRTTGVVRSSCVITTIVAAHSLLFHLLSWLLGHLWINPLTNWMVILKSGFNGLNNWIKFQFL